MLIKEGQTFNRQKKEILQKVVVFINKIISSQIIRKEHTNHGKTHLKSSLTRDLVSLFL